MKSKLSLALVLATPLIALLIVVNFLNKPKTKTSKVAMNITRCTSTNFLLSEVDTTRAIAPLFNNLGEHTYKVSTESERAQSFFNQGLNLTYAFNHAESHRSFMEAARLDKNMAMAYWGQAYALGPNINDQFPDAERKQKAYEAVQKALEYANTASEKEQDMIEALTFRYSNDSIDIKELNRAYMKAMEKVVQKYPKDVDILTLYAASVMNTVPWDYWDKDGTPSPNIKEAKMALEDAVALNPNHPGANHYYIHMVELPKPDLGVGSADRLAESMPGAGHIVHMPSHIYMRVGRYDDAVKSNIKAVEADESYISQCYSQGMYPLSYYPHNIHFLWSAASMQGNSKLAIESAKKTAEKIPANILDQGQFFENFSSTPLLAYTRFGKWNDILTTPNPGVDLTYKKIIYHYARGIAFLRKNNLKEALEELEEMKTRNTEKDDERGALIAKVAHEILAGEIEYFKGNKDKSIEHLKQAVAYEDELPYDEPAAWYIPTRQSLGAFLIKAKKYEEAEKIYLEDLEYYRDNGWSLMGLYTSLIGQNKMDQAKEIKNKFDKVWSEADIEINSSIF